MTCPSPNFFLLCARRSVRMTSRRASESEGRGIKEGNEKVREGCLPDMEKLRRQLTLTCVSGVFVVELVFIKFNSVSTTPNSISFVTFSSIQKKNTREKGY